MLRAVQRIVKQRRTHAANEIERECEIVGGRSSSTAALHTRIDFEQFQRLAVISSIRRTATRSNMSNRTIFSVFEKEVLGQ